MAATAPATRDGFAADLRTALHIADTALVPKTRVARAAIFADWVIFCTDHATLPSLSNIPVPETKLAYLLVFALRRRQQLAACSGQPVRAGTVEDALLAVGQGISALGEPDPRKEVPGSQRNHPLLASFLKSLRDSDSPASRSYPANLTILRQLPLTLDTRSAPTTPMNMHICDLCVVGFYWLLRPAEYLHTAGTGRSQAFRLCDITFAFGDRIVLASDSSLNDVSVTLVTRAILTFTDQKNAVRGEQISHTTTADPFLCPCKALVRLCQRLLHHHAAPTTPIHTYFTPAGTCEHISQHHVTTALRTAACHVRHLTGIDPALLSARSLRPGGATALLCSGIDSNIIQLLGRWKSDAMLRYLRVAAHATSANFAQRMLDAGTYTFAPTSFAHHHQPLPLQTPIDVLAGFQREGLSSSL